MENIRPALLALAARRILLGVGCLGSALALAAERPLSSAWRTEEIPAWQENALEPVRGAQVDESAAKIVFHVRPDSRFAHDENPPGDSSQPHASLQGALAAARNLLARGEGVRIRVYPGVYRESLRLDGLDSLAEARAPLVIESAGEGPVIFSGAAPLTGWTQDGDGVWSAAWPWALGPISYSDRWPAPTDPVLLRVETLSYDGAFLRQTTSREELRQPRRFLVDESAGRIWLSPPADAARDTSRALIEAGDPARDRLLFFRNLRSGVVLRGLVFEHGAGAPGRPAVTFDHCAEVLVENCVFRGNNWNGLHFRDSSGITLRGSRFDFHGDSAFTAMRVQGLLVEDCEIAGANQRGDSARWWEWNPAGAKLMHVHDVVLRRLKVAGNLARGVWLDSDCARVLMERLEVADNLGDGIYVERNQGPVVLRDSRITGNGGAGVNIISQSVALLRNVIHGNANPLRAPGEMDAFTPRALKGEKIAQIVFRYHSMRREVLLGADKALVARGLTHNAWRGNLISGTHPGIPLVDLPAWPELVETLENGANLYLHPRPTHAFAAFTLPLSLADWQDFSGTDLDSRMLTAGTTDADAALRDALGAPPGPARVGAPPAPVQVAADRAVRYRAALADYFECRIPFPSLRSKKGEAPVFVPLRLDSAFNRPFSAPANTVAINLPHLESGPRTLYGVPFVLGPQRPAAESDEKPAMIGLGPWRREGIPTPPLEKVVLEWDDLAPGRSTRLERIFFLHAAAPVMLPTEVGAYVVEYADGSSERVPMRVLGRRMPAEAEAYHALASAANAQGTERALTHLHEALVRAVPVYHETSSIPEDDIEEANSRRDLVRAAGRIAAGIVGSPRVSVSLSYLYAFDWKNPHPDRKIRRLRLEAAPGCTWALLAATGVATEP